MANNQYSFSGPGYGLQPPNSFANFGANWGMPQQLPYEGGLNPNGLDIYGGTGALDSINPLSALSAPPPGTGSMFSGVGDWFKDSGFLGSTKDGVKTDGWGGMALGALSGLGSAYMGMKQYGLAQDAFAENKRQFGLNYDAQRTTTNSALEDRQRARVASNAGAYESVGNYMGRNGIK